MITPICVHSVHVPVPINVVSNLQVARLALPRHFSLYTHLNQIFHAYIMHMQDASNKAMGVCVSSYHNENINTPKERGTLKAFTTFVQNIIPNLKLFQADTYISQIKHPIDALFSWAIGVVSGMQDVVGTIDMAHCKLPDFYMQDVFKCSCNDKPFTIPAARARETYADGAFWCSGNLPCLV